MSQNAEIVAQRLLIKGIVSEMELGALVEKYQNQFNSILNSAAEISEEETQAVYMALTLVGLDMAEGLL